jgi:hypothetical protein
MQISGLLGQIELEGKRPPVMIRLGTYIAIPVFKKLSIFGSQNNATFIFHRLVLRRVHFTNSNFA